MFRNSALDCWSEEVECRPIITLCRSLDKLLDGGIPPKSITEFCGGPGMGKTQLCFQLCVNVQFPVEVGGIGGKAVYIDTNQGFSPFRLKEIAQHSAERYHQTYRKLSNKKTLIPEFNVDRILDNVLYVYCQEYLELLATIETLRSTLANGTNIKLVVIDSFSFPFRNFHNNTSRTRIVCELLTDLQELADQYNLAVVITNEFTTRLYTNGAIVCPALGESLAHKVGQRIVLSRDKEQNNVAFLAKTYNCSKTGIPFKIKRSGIREKI